MEGCKLKNYLIFKSCLLGFYDCTRHLADFIIIINDKNYDKEYEFFVKVISFI